MLESDLHNLNLRGNRSKIYKLSDKLLKLNNAEQKDLTDKHVKSFYSSIGYDDLSSSLEHKLTLNTFELKVTNKLFNKWDK